MPAPPRSHRRRLRVEGTDDLHAIVALLSRHGADFATPDPRLPHLSAEPEGMDQALAAIEVGAKTYERFGLVIDSELPERTDVHRWAQARGRMRAAGITVPEELPVDGLVVAGLRPGHRVGLWLMPDNAGAGTLEHLLTTLISAGDGTLPIAEEATDRALAGGAPIAARDQLKGVLHAWLAWRERPGMPFGTAITAHALGHESPQALAFVAWFRRLFDAP